MSSAINHRKRSHRSEAKKSGALSGMSRKNYINQFNQSVSKRRRLNLLRLLGLTSGDR